MKTILRNPSFLFAGAIASTLALSNLPALSQNAGDVIVSHSAWLGGNGVDVHWNANNETGCWGSSYTLDPVNNTTYYTGCEWQCGELAMRFYTARGFYPGNFGVDYAYQIYDAAGRLGMTAHANGSGYVPVAGDMVIWASNSNGSGVAGHVAVIAGVDPYHVYLCEQNFTTDGRASCTRSGASGSSLTRDDGWGTIRGVVHSPNNNLTHYTDVTPGATLVSQTIADGASMNAGQNFMASFTMKNTLSSSWLSGGSGGFTFNFISGTQMAAAGATPINNNVAPNGTYTFNISMTAPTAPGTYTAYFQMNNAGSYYFGQVVHVQIVVGGTKVTAIVDNSNSGFSASANWTTGSSSTDKYGSDYRYRSTAATSDQAVWTANLANTGTYNVYAWWSQGSNRSASAAYSVTDSAGTTHTVSVNQQSGGGQWNLLGSYGLNSGNNSVKLSCWTTTGFVVVADAIKWVQQ